MEKKTRARFAVTTLKKTSEADHNWIILDAAGKTLGRFASEVAKILRGKHKVYYTPHVDCGDGVIVVNADKIIVTGNKEAQKIYHEYTGWIGGQRDVNYRDMMQKNPAKIIEYAVNGMLPHGRLARRQAKRLRILARDESLLEAQKPLKVNI